MIAQPDIVSCGPDAAVEAGAVAADRIEGLQAAVLKLLIPQIELNGAVGNENGPQVRNMVQRAVKSCAAGIDDEPVLGPIVRRRDQPITPF